MDWVQGGHSTAPALGRLETTPADGDRSNPPAGDPFFSGRQINGGGVGGGSNVALNHPEYCAYPRWDDRPQCTYGPACNPKVPANDSENIIVPANPTSLYSYEWTIPCES
ncbi:hypothetical protein ACQJBY_032393 [Aegilops geniculata]